MKKDLVVDGSPDWFANNPQIVCTYYGYTTPAVSGSLNPCGIFVSLFNEAWIERGAES